MTGLNRDTDTIMSICCFVTDYDLNVLDDKGFETVIHHNKNDLDRMGDWCKDTHGRTGLTDACLASTTTAEAAATNLLKYVQRYVPERRRGLLAGNSVHCDKEFLRRQPFDKALDYLSYRIMDVSTVKEMAKRWAPEGILKHAPPKKGLHQAREDILESIAEAAYYRKVFFLGKEDVGKKEKEKA